MEQKYTYSGTLVDCRLLGYVCCFPFFPIPGQHYSPLSYTKMASTTASTLPAYSRVNPAPTTTASLHPQNERERAPIQHREMGGHATKLPGYASDPEKGGLWKRNDTHTSRKQPCEKVPDSRASGSGIQELDSLLGYRPISRDGHRNGDRPERTTNPSRATPPVNTNGALDEK